MADPQSQVPVFLNTTINIEMCNNSLKEEDKTLLEKCSVTLSLSPCLSFSLSAVFPCEERGCSACTLLSSVNKASSFCREEEKERLTTMGYYWPS